MFKCPLCDPPFIGSFGEVVDHFSEVHPREELHSVPCASPGEIAALQERINSFKEMRALIQLS